jgi:hypothetical protein
MKTLRTLLLVTAGALLLTPIVNAQRSFSLDDNPSAPIGPYFGIIPGFGAEDPYGLPAPPWWPPGLAPSPSLGGIPGLALFDGDVLSPGPVLQIAGPDGAFLDALSNMSVDPGFCIRLKFSVDRFSFGAPGTAVATEAGFNQQPGDIYRTREAYLSPGVFAGTLGPGPFAGFLPAPRGLSMNNRLVLDESALGLVVGGPGLILPPGVLAPPIMPASHDNVDAYDDNLLGAGGTFIGWTYFAVAPDAAAIAGVSAADLFDVAPGAPGTVPVPYAMAVTMGLDTFGGPNSDSIDALIMFDNGAPGGPANGGPGGEPVIDYALFSLAPGSASLPTLGLSAADVFFTDFTGAFAVYAPSLSMGLTGAPGGFPGAGDNVDAMEIPCFGDLNDDGFRNVTDFTIFAAAYGSIIGGATYNPDADLNGDGRVNVTDFTIFAGVYRMPCP